MYNLECHHYMWVVIYTVTAYMEIIKWDIGMLQVMNKEME